MISELGLTVLFLAAQLVFVIALVALVAKFITIAISNGFDSPFLATPHEYLPKIAEALAVRSGDVVYELGSGDGRLVFFCGKQYPDAQFIGIERNPLLVFYANMRKKMLGNPSNISFRQEDFFNTDFTKATHIYAYLLPGPLNKLFPKMRSAGKKRLVSRAYWIYDEQKSATVTLSETPGTHGEHLLHIYSI